MFYTIYQITNLINGKIYIGSHVTNNLKDGYMGSGKLIRSAFKKYGIENFEKKILSKHKTKELMYRREAKIVNEEFVKREDTYNIKIGGSGGWDHIPRDHWTKSRKHMKMMNRVGKENRLKALKEIYKDEERVKEINKKRTKTIFERTGYYGTSGGRIFITHLELKQNKQVFKEEAKSYYSQGWQFGTTYFSKVGIQSKELKEALKGLKNILKTEKEKLFNDVDNYTEFQFKRKTEILKKKQELIKSKINFETHGWVGEVTSLINVSNGRWWMQREFPELYKFCKQRG